MILKNDVKEIAVMRFKDASVLLQKRRYNGSVCMGGYCIELILKYNICDLLKLTEGYPETKSDLNLYSNYSTRSFIIKTERADLKLFKSHNLNNLLQLSGKEPEIKNLFFKEWDQIKIWNTNLRYNNSYITSKEAKLFYKSVNNLMHYLIK